MWRSVTYGLARVMHVLHVFSTAPRTDVPLTPCCIRVVHQLTSTVLPNRGHIIMQSIIDTAMTRKWLGVYVE